MSRVTQWLEKLGLGQYAAVFSENAIDLDVLPELSESDLGSIGVLLGHRKKILQALATIAGRKHVDVPVVVHVRCRSAVPIEGIGTGVERSQRRQVEVNTGFPAHLGEEVFRRHHGVKRFDRHLPNGPAG